MKDIGVTNYCSEPCLGRSKESNNHGIKVQAKRTFKCYFFWHEKKADRLCLKSSWTPSTNLQQVPQPLTSFQMFQISNVPFLFCILFLNHQVRINKVGNKYCPLLPQSLRITLKCTSSNISTDPVGLYLSTNFCKFPHKLVYPSMVVKNIQFMLFK